MTSILAFFRSLFRSLKKRLSPTWRKYRGLRPWKQWVIAILLAILLIGGIAFAHSGGEDGAASQDRTVTLATISSLSGNGSGTSMLGTVRSVTEAELFAQNGGTVKRVNTTLGATVGAGAVIAELDNSSEAAAVLQAEGAYDAAVASRNITLLQSGGAQTSFAEAQQAARTSYRTAFTALDTTLENDIDTFFGAPDAIGPKLLIYPDSSEANRLSRERTRIEGIMNTYQANLATADRRDPQVLLDEAQGIARQMQIFVTSLAAAANERDSRATSAQLAALASARATVDSELATLSSASDAYNAKKTAAQVGSRSTTSGTQLASADAAVKSALGNLRGAQANLEKTRVRATIGGTVNFLPIRAGEYVAAFTHVATVAQNGALEIVAYVSEEDRENLTVGMKVGVEGGYTGIITAIAPALDPVNKQIEVHVAVDAGASTSAEAPLVNGQSVRITLPDAAPVSTSTVAGPILLPLSAVKLRADERIVFTVDAESRLVAYPVEIGDVHGDRIEITSQLPLDLRIVTDARGLSEGQRVRIAEET